MNAPDSPEQATPVEGSSSAEHPCPACAKPLAADATRCPHCGLVLGEHRRCPHCHAIADVEVSRDARFICAVCGGVRIPIEDPDVARSPEQIDFLKQATTARSAKVVWRIIAVVVGTFGLVSVLVLWLAITFAHPPAVASIVAAGAVLVPFGFALFAVLRSVRCARDFPVAFERAWTRAAADIARARGGEIDAGALAKQTRIGESEADAILARMSAESLLTSSVTADGGLKYALVEGAAAGASKALPAAR